MAKTILGVDIGYDTLKLALVNGRTVRKAAVVPMPKNLIREGRIVSTETMGELIRKTMREHGIRGNQAAIALPNETVFIRSVTMPLMTIDQLNYNLPFEFRDYITDELKDYYYDYAVVSTSEESREENTNGESGEDGENGGTGDAAPGGTQDGQGRADGLRLPVADPCHREKGRRKTAGILHP